MTTNHGLLFDAVVIMIITEDKTIYETAKNIDSALGNDKLQKAFCSQSSARIKDEIVDTQIKEYAEKILHVEVVNRKPTHKEMGMACKLSKEIYDEHYRKIGINFYGQEYAIEMKNKDIVLLKGTARLLIFTMLLAYFGPGLGLQTQPIWFNMLFILRIAFTIQIFKLVYRVIQMLGGN